MSAWAASRGLTDVTPSPMSAITRDAAGVRRRSRTLRRPRPRRNVERMVADDRDAAAVVLHVDVDQFLAAVEIRRRPELAGKPVVVGGDGNPSRRRQVVATASYEARAAGVHAGMPLGLAARRCPDAVFLASDRPAYDAASAEVMATLRSFPVTVEVWGWDEAFIGAHTDDPESLAVELRAGVLAATGLSCAVGIGDTRLLAKTATAAAKPGGIARLTRRQWMETKANAPVTEIWGIGERIAARLAEAGIHTVAQLATADATISPRGSVPALARV